MEETQEREGEEELAVVVPEVEADEDLGVLGTVPLLTEAGEVKVDEKEEAKATEAEAEAEAEEEEESEESKAAKELRRDYLKQVKAFYKERNIYFQGQRNVSEQAKEAFRRNSRMGKQDSPLAQITKDGQQILLKKDGKIIYQITPVSYRDSNQEEHKTIQKRREAAIKTAEEAFEMARDSLRALYKTESTFEDVKEATRLVLEADLKLQTARFAEKELTPYYVPIALLTLNKQDTGRASAGAFAGTPMTLQQRYAVVDTGGSEESKAGIDTPEVILICYPEDGDHGFMSSWFMKEFSYHKRKYSCAFQAIMSEMARKFGNEEEADRIMDEEDPRDMALLWDKLEVGEGEEPITQEKWNERLGKIIMKVNLKKFENLKLAQQLAATGTKQIGYVPPENDKDTFQGTGLPFDDERSYQPHEWTGENLYGQVLEQIRAVIAEKLQPAPKKTAAKKAKSVATVATAIPVTPATPVVPATELAINTAPVAAAPLAKEEEGEEKEAAPEPEIP
jgi:ribA/ribD-fused uncharacterized protein